MLTLLVIAAFSCGAARAFDVPPFVPNVVDVSGTLSAEQISELNAAIDKLRIEGKVLAAVLVVRTTAPESIEQAATAVFDRWALGKKGNDNGLLILVALEDRQMRIEVGYGLEGQITDVQASRIVRNVMAPRFKQQDYAGGIREALFALNQLASGSEVAAFAENEAREVSVPDDGSANTTNISGDRVKMLIPIWVVLILVLPMIVRWIAVRRAARYEASLQPSASERSMRQVILPSGGPLFVALFLLVNPGVFFVIFGAMFPWATLLFTAFAYIFLVPLNWSYVSMLRPTWRRSYINRPKSSPSRSGGDSSSSWSSSSSSSSSSGSSSSSSSSSSSGGGRSGGGGSSGSW